MARLTMACTIRVVIVTAFDFIEDHVLLTAIWRLPNQLKDFNSFDRSYCLLHFIISGSDRSLRSSLQYFLGLRLLTVSVYLLINSFNLVIAICLIFAIFDFSYTLNGILWHKLDYSIIAASSAFSIRAHVGRE